MVCPCLVTRKRVPGRHRGLTLNLNLATRTFKRLLHRETVELKIAALDRNYSLSDSQKKKLKILGKGAVELSSQEVGAEIVR